jgi:hypothetical protein
MRQTGWMGRMIAIAGAAWMGTGVAAGEVTSQETAALLNFPLIEVEEAAMMGGWEDTVVQLTNDSEESVAVHCFYENSNAHCTNTGEVCEDGLDCCDAEFCGVCLPGWNETDFRIRLTPGQPIAWRASEGLADFPIDGVLRTGIGGSSNAGSRIPPVPENPFTGMLRCLVVDEQGNPDDRNVLRGSATIEYTTEGFPQQIDLARYNAVGNQAIEGALNDDRDLIVGGEGAEYEGCPDVLIVNHFFDFGINPLSGFQTRTTVALMPCAGDLLRQEPASTVVQYLVYNEFEQRFSTSRTVDCQQAIPLSDIDTTQPLRSIFSAGVSGTLSGQTRLSPLETGLVAVAVEAHFPGEEELNAGSSVRTAAFNVHFQGERGESDQITLP